MRKKWFCLFMPFLAACGTALPPQRPADFRFTYSISGGMMPLWTQVDCDAQSCSYRHSERGQQTELKGVPTPAALDSVYQAFRDNAFDRVRMSKHGVIYDSGGSNIVLWAAGKSYSKGASATASVDKRDNARIDAVSSAIGRFMKTVFGDALQQKK